MLTVISMNQWNFGSVILSTLVFYLVVFFSWRFVYGLCLPKCLCIRIAVMKCAKMSLLSEPDRMVHATRLAVLKLYKLILSFYCTLFSIIIFLFSQNLKFKCFVHTHQWISVANRPMPICGSCLSSFAQMNQKPIFP